MERAAPRPSDDPDAGFGVYVHWPFCASKCPYCDFNSHVRHEPVDQASFVTALERELDTFAARTPGRTVESVFFGGGTPSLMEPASVADVLDKIADLWSIAPDTEITLEANPSSVEVNRFRGYRTAGVNRVSLGVQALNDADLKALGRLHSAEEANAALATARDVFDRVSFDLIYARPHQTLDDWRAELSDALHRGPDHLSLYQLTIEPGTPFAALHSAGKLTVPDPDLAADLYQLTQDMTAEAGLPAYEISNHARPGAESRHNLIYWRQGDYVGVGPGAHGRLGEAQGRIATSTERHPETWRARVLAEGHALTEDLILDDVEIADEFLVMGLRLAEGISLSRYAALFGQPLKPSQINVLEADGLITRLGDDRIRATPDGFLVLNALVADLAA
ncbi:MAG: radical SAM family heme chaperone HemW [Pseudomonadota bacterium]